MALDEYESGDFKKCQVRWSVFKEIFDELEELYLGVNNSEKSNALSRERHKVAARGW